MTKQLKSKLWLLMPPIFFIVLNLFLFVPGAIYKGNASEFSFTLFNILAPLILPALIFLLALLLTGIFLPRKLLVIYTALLFGGGVMIWIQSSFLVWDYGVFDGNTIDWNANRWNGKIDILCWVLIFSLSIIFSKRVIKFTSIASFSLIGLLGLLFMVPLVNNKPNTTAQNFQMRVPQEIYNYSKDFNIIHIMMDNFQTDVLLELISENSYEKDLVGFTVFRENLASANSTTICIPSIFSAEHYRGVEPISDFFTDKIQNHSFQKTLYDNGFKINISSYFNLPVNREFNYYKIPSIYGGTLEEERLLASIKLLNISLFRALPEVGKKKVYNNGNWRMWLKKTAKSDNVMIISNFNFFKDYTSQIKITDTLPSYHYVFISPPHPPFYINENGEIDAKVRAATRKNYKHQAKASLKLFIDFIKRLKTMGLYDSSLIVLQSDHGSLMKPIMDGKMLNLPLYRAPAMLAIKTPNRKKTFSISNAQTMNTDLAATIMDIVNIKHNFNGISVFKLKEDEPRQRFISTPKMIFKINGSIYKEELWQISDTFNIQKDIPHYKWGDIVQFGAKGNAFNYQGEGWSNPLENHEWNNGKSFTLNFSTIKTNKNILLTVNFIPYIKKGFVNKQRVYLYFNDHKIAEWNLSTEEGQSKSVIIPNKLLTNENFTLKFECPDAVSPKSLNISTDVRELAIAMLNLKMEEIK